MKKVLILGAYGIFGQRIAIALIKSNISVIINGRNLKSAEKLAREIKQKFPSANLAIAIFDAEKELSTELVKLNPALVINTCGPFQLKNYSIAENCIAAKIPYIDLADGREFARDIVKLNNAAKKAGVLVVSGASTVPGLSSAVIEHFKNQFRVLDSVHYGIAPGQNTHRGLATAQSILSYLGKPIKAAAYKDKIHYGWQDLYCQKYPVVGNRWMANCDIPDLDLFPAHYQIRELHFSAGMESRLLHFGIWSLSWLVRLGLPLHLEKHAHFLWKASMWFNWLGTADGGMHMTLSGKDLQNQPKTIKWFIIVKNGDGPQVPTIPAIVLAKKILNDELKITGALPCVGLVSLEEYLHELRDFAMETYVE